MQLPLPAGTLQGFTRQPESPNVHARGSRLKHHQNSTRRPPREGEKNENCGGRGKKARTSGPPPFGASILRGLHLRGPPFGAPLFLSWGLHPSGPPLFVAPLQDIQNWPKSKLAEVDRVRLRWQTISMIGWSWGYHDDDIITLMQNGNVKAQGHVEVTVLQIQP